MVARHSGGVRQRFVANDVGVRYEHSVRVAQLKFRIQVVHEFAGAASRTRCLQRKRLAGTYRNPVRIRAIRYPGSVAQRVAHQQIAVGGGIPETRIDRRGRREEIEQHYRCGERREIGHQGGAIAPTGNQICVRVQRPGPAVTEAAREARNIFHERMGRIGDGAECKRSSRGVIRLCDGVVTLGAPPSLRSPSWRRGGKGLDDHSPAAVHVVCQNIAQQRGVGEAIVAPDHHTVECLQGLQSRRRRSYVDGGDRIKPT